LLNTKKISKKEKKNTDSLPKKSKSIEYKSIAIVNYNPLVDGDWALATNKKLTAAGYDLVDFKPGNAVYEMKNKKKA
jgi:hypothetical protein